MGELAELFGSACQKGPLKLGAAFLDNNPSTGAQVYLLDGKELH